MGRARSHTKTAAVQHFNNVLGVRRGSKTAQAQRDDNEAKTRAHERDEQEGRALSEFVKAVRGLSDFESLTTSTLIPAHKKKISPAEALTSLSKSLEVRNRAGKSARLVELAVVVKLGDPELCPGLSAPAVQALTAYFRQEPINPAEAAERYRETEALLDKISGGVHDLAYYQRLQPLYEALVPVIVDATNSATSNATVSAYAAHELAVVVPEAAITGPLSCWVEAFTHRLDGSARSSLEEVNDIHFLLHTYKEENAPSPALSELRRAWERRELRGQAPSPPA